jgi:hypothetical protein
MHAHFQHILPNPHPSISSQDNLHATMAAVSVGDIIAAAKFFHSVYQNIKDADVEFNNFKLAARQLGDVLEELFKALEEQQRIIHNRGASTRLKGPHKDDMKTLRDILGDFQLLQYVYEFI